MKNRGIKSINTYLGHADVAITEMGVLANNGNPNFLGYTIHQLGQILFMSWSYARSPIRAILHPISPYGTHRKAGWTGWEYSQQRVADEEPEGHDRCCLHRAHLGHSPQEHRRTERFSVWSPKCYNGIHNGIHNSIHNGSHNDNVTNWSL